ncbi:MAG: IgGFc-binding protein, partial [Ignavibacteria bacterium]|nr:IgGFc-binding protein [Ignavibacteria bacterium]
MGNFRLLLVFMFFLAIVFVCNSQEYSDEEIKSALPKMLGATNVGKEFWFSIPPCYPSDPTDDIKVYITSPYRTKVTIQVPGEGWQRTVMTVPNDVTMLELTPTMGQPYMKYPPDPEVPDNVFFGRGVNIVSEHPIVVYVVVRYYATSDGFLAVPVSSLGKEYIIAGYPVDPMFRAVWNLPLPNVCLIVAPYDQTKVRFTLGGNSMTVTAGGLKPGQTREVTLNRGDVFALSTKGDGGDLSGSRVVANKPVAVVTGNQCTNIPNGNQWCDYTVEMDLPTYTWGKDYLVPKIPGRVKPPIIRVYAKERNTTIYRDGKEFGFLKATDFTEGNRFLETRLSPGSPRSAIISGDKPIGVTLYNTGSQEDGQPCISDPFVMVITPMEQFQKEVTFCLPGTFGGKQFRTANYVALVYQTDENGMIPDDLEFAEVRSGRYVWTKIKNRFPGVDELFAYKVNEKQYAMKILDLPSTGVFKIRAKNPFACYSFGYDWCDSYGYPTSAALADLEKPDTVPPDPKWK